MALTKVKSEQLDAAQTSITSVGTLTGLTVSGDLTVDTSTFVVDATNNRVGIGTTSPADALHILDTSGHAYASVARSTQSQGEVGLRLRGGTSGNDWYIYQKPSNNNLNFYNTSDRMTIDSSGNVGIGTTPSGVLSLGYVLRLNGGTQTFLAFNNTTHTTQATGGFAIGHDASSSYIVQRENQPLDFYTNNLFRMRIDSSGRVGIGSNSPNSRLYVQHSLSEYTTSLAETTTKSTLQLKTHAGDSTITTFGGVSGGNAYIQRSNGPGTTPYAILLNPYGGNVGIGTSSPSDVLHAVGPTINLERQSNSAGFGVGFKFSLGDSASTTANHNYASIFGVIEDNTNGAEDGYLSFQTSLSGSVGERMRIDSSGRITMPYQPGFFARGNTSQWLNLASGWSTLKNGIAHASGGYIGVNLTSAAQTHLNGYNIGSDFNASNGRFTAPVEGKYHIHGSIYAQKYSSSATANDYIHFLVYINGQQLNEIYTIGGYGQPTNYEFSNNISTIILLEANDYVEWKVYSSSTYMRLYGDHISIGAHMIS